MNNKNMPFIKIKNYVNDPQPYFPDVGTVISNL